MDQSSNEFEGSNFILVHDNAPCHASKVTKNYFSEQNITTCDWPLKSPNMNIIKDVWAVLDTAIRLKDKEITNKESLFQVIEEEWY